MNASAVEKMGGGAARPGWVAGLREDYDRVFVKEWSPYLGAVLLVIAVAVLMLSGLFWGVFGGVKLWGDWINRLVGIGPLLGIGGELENPLMQRISLMNITLIIGAFAAALFSRQFHINRPPKLEYFAGAFGGILMGIGASLAGGCTTGGFFTPLIFGSPAGWVMAVGLLAGAWVGLKLLLWTSEHITWGTTPPPPARGESRLRRYYPLFGLLVAIATVAWAVAWYSAPDSKLVNRAIIVPGGFAIGFILHRSRLCFARVFREPFMTGEGSLTKAMILALALGIPIGSLLLQHKTVDPFLAIPASFWLGSLVGGAIFGVGMVYAGGCASGSMWRMAEGQLKLWVALFFFAWSGSIFNAIVKRWDLLTREMTLDLVEVTKVGYQAYFPDLLDGWAWTYLVSAGILLLWYLLVRYNESTEKFTVL